MESEDNKCVVCGLILDVNTVIVKERGLLKFVESSIVREDGKEDCFKYRNEIKLHKTCRNTYNNPKCIEAEKKRKKKESEKVSESIDSNFDFQNKCLFCDKDASFEFERQQSKNPSSSRILVGHVKRSDTQDAILKACTTHDDDWSKEVSMMSAVSGSGDQLLRRVKQEAEPPPQYSPTEQLALSSPHPRPMLLQPEMELEPKEEVKFCVSPGEGIVGNTSPEQQHCSSTTAAAPSARDDDAPRRLCLVCGDVASGFHYGVASCEACKAFFKRTIQGNIEYTCPASNECEINKRRRKACQACRFRKCLRTGMLREGVRLDRVRGGRQKYRRAPDQPPPAPRPHLDDIKILEVLSSYEPEPFSCGAAPAGVTEPAARTLAVLADLYDRELVGVISWAKQIPGFTDLQLNDQMRLLQSTWAEMLSLMLAYRSVSGAGGGAPRLRFATDLALDEQQARDIGAGELFAQVSGVAKRLERAAALREECYLLKALVLANSEARLEEHAALRRFRDSILAALNDAVSALRPYNAGAALQQLLLVLPALRHADVAVRRFWAQVYRDRRAPMNKLFVEMLEACLR